MIELTANPKANDAARDKIKKAGLFILIFLSNVKISSNIYSGLIFEDKLRVKLIQSFCVRLILSLSIEKFAFTLLVAPLIIIFPSRYSIK